MSNEAPQQMPTPIEVSEQEAIKAKLEGFVGKKVESFVVDVFGVIQIKFEGGDSLIINHEGLEVIQ